ncbi:MAG: hypothetical protein JWP74_3532 [Marmoricola sp.]|nr:hypothetical protein [Marmoricola sp.]
MTATQHRRLIALVAVVACALGLTACGSTKAPVALRAMPNLVGMTVGDGEQHVYDVLHTSLLYYDQAPVNRLGVDNTWVIVATYPAAGVRTAKYKLVYAWALRKSEYDWFTAHPTMPRIAARTPVAKLIGPGGVLAPVKELVKVRYRPGAAPSSAKADPADAAAFKPNRVDVPDPSTQPLAEWALYKGLLVAPVARTLTVAVRPGAGTALRVGQFLVLLAIRAPVSRSSTGGSSGGVSYTPPSGSSGSGTSGGTSGGSGSGLPSGLGGVKIPHLHCPNNLC